MMSARSPGEGSREGNFFTVVHFSGFSLESFLNGEIQGHNFISSFTLFTFVTGVPIIA